eukprot:scaffold2.g7365.t1
MPHSAADLLLLQGNIKRDPQGYSDEFQLQWRHFAACLQLFLLKPAQDAAEFGELVTFIAQVSSCYPRETEGFASQLMELLEKHHAVLDPALRQTLVKALILLRNRGQLAPTALLPLLFKLFRVQDKALRQLVFRHITADIKNSNKRQRNERLNRAVQNFMYSVLQDEHEASAKKGLAVLTEMWRRHVWRDARTVNVIASAALHKSSRVMLAALKFFLGQDAEEDKGDGSDDSDSEGEGKAAAQGPSREEVYAAYHKGTVASKKKKQKKLKRAMASVKRQTKKGGAGRQESFAALQLLHDPQGFAERLFARLQGGRERFEARLALMNVVSRAVGVHKLLLLNFYPFLQKYIAPSQRDVTAVLAALVQACHEQVPPEALAPVVRQLVDQFVHDRARPEVVTVGLKADLTAYKKDRDKAVSSAARGLIGLFRELAPGMLEKKDRGRGADVGLRPMEYGAAQVATRIEGAELLEQAIREGKLNSDGELISSSESEGEEEEDAAAAAARRLRARARRGAGGGSMGGGESGSEGEEDDGAESVEWGSSEEEEEEEQSGEESGSDAGEEEEGSEGAGASGSEDEKASASGSEAEGEELEAGPLGEEDEEDESDEGGAAASSSGGQEEEDEEEGGGSSRQRKRPRLEPARPPRAAQAGSLAQLKRQLAAAKQQQQQQEEQQEQQGQEERQAAGGAEGAAQAEGGEEAVPLEWGRILTEEDFETIRRLKHRRMVEAAMQKHGLKSARKRDKARQAAEEAADEALALQARLGVANEQRVNPDDLLGRHKYRRDKEERLKSVLEGREGRLEFGAKSRLAKKKTGGLSNREKAKRKRLPMAARAGQARKRQERKKKLGSKNFKGHQRS